MKKLNKKTIIVSALITAVLLFGGWFSMQFFNVEKPLEDFAQELDGLDMLELNNDQEEVIVEIALTDGKHFARNYLAFKQLVHETIENKEIYIQVTPKQGEHHPFWLAHSAPFMQFIHQGEFAAIEEQMDGLQAQGIIEEGSMMMNNEYLFMHFKLPEEEDVYVVLDVPLQKGGEQE